GNGARREGRTARHSRRQGWREDQGDRHRRAPATRGAARAQGASRAFRAGLATLEEHAAAAGGARLRQTGSRDRGRTRRRRRTPIVAIVGRPNVGKSTLFNRFAGKDLAIVYDEPGVTRERHYADAHLHGRDLTLIDTGGFDPTTSDPVGVGIVRHVEAAIAAAHVILCLLA